RQCSPTTTYFGFWAGCSCLCCRSCFSWKSQKAAKGRRWLIKPGPSLLFTLRSLDSLDHDDGDPLSPLSFNVHQPSAKYGCGNLRRQVAMKIEVACFPVLPLPPAIQD